MSNLAIIPARGGSKRIPGKNIKNFLGKPIIAYSIEKALESDLFDEVMVSTDDEEIAQVAEDYGAEIPFIRSNKNSDDYATLNDVVTEVIGNYSKAGNEFNFACCILATAPLLQRQFLIEGLNLMKKEGFDSVRPIVEYEYPISKAFKLSNNSVSFINKQRETRSQDFKKYYHDAGLFYWFIPNYGLKGENRGGFEIPRIYAQDIDEEADWEICTMKYKYLSERKE